MTATPTTEQLITRVVRYAIPITGTATTITADPAASVVHLASRDPGVLDVWLTETRRTSPDAPAEPAGRRTFLVLPTGAWAPPGHTYEGTALSPDLTIHGGPPAGTLVWHLFERTSDSQ